MDFEQYAISTPGPDSAVENFKLVAKALRKVNLKLTKKDVAGMGTLSTLMYSFPFSYWLIKMIQPS